MIGLLLTPTTAILTLKTSSISYCHHKKRAGREVACRSVLGGFLRCVDYLWRRELVGLVGEGPWAGVPACRHLFGGPWMQESTCHSRRADNWQPCSRWNRPWVMDGRGDNTAAYEYSPSLRNTRQHNATSITTTTSTSDTSSTTTTTTTIRNTTSLDLFLIFTAP